MAGNNTSEINALLGKGSEFEGKLTFEGTVRIDGKFHGEIFSDDVLIVGEGAQVEAEIKVSRVIIYGNVKGNLVAPGGVNLHAPAKLSGSITTKALTIDEGVIFEGTCHMDSKNEAKKSVPAFQAVKREKNGEQEELAPKK